MYTVKAIPQETGEGVATHGWQITNNLKGSPMPTEFEIFINELKECEKIVGRAKFSSYFYWWQENMFSDWSQRAVVIWDTTAMARLQRIPMEEALNIRKCFKGRNENATPTFKWNRILPHDVITRSQTYTINYKNISHFIVDVADIKIIQYIVLFDFSAPTKSSVDCAVKIYYLNTFLNTAMENLPKECSALPEWYAKQGPHL